MATHGELTVGKLKHFLNAFSDETKVVMGQPGKAESTCGCHANTYYPPEQEEEWPLVVIDAGDNL